MIRIRIPRFCFILLIAFLTHPLSLKAIEVYTFINRGCQTETGLIIGLEKDTVSIINIEGKLKTFPRKGVDHILIYKLVNNPLAEIDLTPPLIKLVKKVYVEKLDKPLFLGWPTRFIDDLVVFYDLKGKNYFIEIDKIYNIENLGGFEKGIEKLDKYLPVQFSFGRNYPECRLTAKTGADVVQPMRLLSDRIKVAKFFDTYEKGFKRIERFKKKKVYYVKPVYYEDKSSLGFKYILKEGETPLNFEGPQEISGGLPLFFRWSGGKPYSYQSNSVVGSATSTLIPNVEPVFQFGSDIKAHLFHASFVINIAGLVPGFPSLIPRMAAGGNAVDSMMTKQTAVVTSFNYAALVGFDYGPYSFSAGNSYPVFGIQTGGSDGLFREVLASEGSPTLRFRYFGDKILFRGLFSQTNYISNNPSFSEIILFPTNQLKDAETFFTSGNWGVFTETRLSSFQLKTDFLRLGFDWDINKEVRFGLDQLYLTGKYQEEIGDMTQPNPVLTTNKVDFLNHTTTVYIKHEFGSQVALTAYFNYFIRKGESSYLGLDDTTNENKYSLTAIIEFLL